MSNVLMSINADQSVILKDIHGNLLYPVTKAELVTGITVDGYNLLAGGDSKLTKYFGYVKDTDTVYITESDKAKPATTTIDIYNIVNKTMTKLTTGYLDMNGALHKSEEALLVYLPDSNKDYKVLSTTSYYAGDGIKLNMTADKDKIISAETGTGIKIDNNKITFNNEDNNVIANGSDGTNNGTSGIIPAPNKKNMVLTSNKDDSTGKVKWIKGLTYTEI